MEGLEKALQRRSDWFQSLLLVESQWIDPRESIVLYMPYLEPHYAEHAVSILPYMCFIL